MLRNALTVYMKLSRLCVISIHTMKENAEALLVAVVNDRGRGTLLYNWKFCIIVLVNHVVIGYIILMVSLRARVFLYSQGKA